MWETRQEAYEVIIGGWVNTVSAIKNATLTVKDNRYTQYLKHSTPKILHCNQFRRFWVSWDNNTVRAGKGQPFEDVFMSWTVPDPHDINAVALNGYQVAADWIVERKSGNLTFKRLI